MSFRAEPAARDSRTRNRLAGSRGIYPAPPTSLLHTLEPARRVAAALWLSKGLAPSGAGFLGGPADIFATAILCIGPRSE